MPYQFHNASRSIQAVYVCVCIWSASVDNSLSSHPCLLPCHCIVPHQSPSSSTRYRKKSHGAHFVADNQSWFPFVDERPIINPARLEIDPSIKLQQHKQSYWSTGGRTNERKRNETKRNGRWGCTIHLSHDTYRERRIIPERVERGVLP